MKQKCKSVKIVKKEFAYTSPTIELHHKIIVLCFTDVYSLQQALQRTHIQYEGNILKGPLRGVNMPFKFYAEWIQLYTNELQANELALLNDISSFFKPTKEIEVNMEDIKELSTDDQIVLDFENTTYLIAYLKGDTSTYIHEMAHATYFLHESYRSLVSECYSTLSPQVAQYINKELAIRGYKKEVYEDEFQAYIIEGPDQLGKKYVNEMSMVRDRLKKCMKEINLKECTQSTISSCNEFNKVKSL